MSLRVALQIHDERAMRHLSSIISLAAQRAAPIKLVAPNASGSDAPEVIVVCEDEPGAQALLSAAQQAANSGDASAMIPIAPAPLLLEIAKARAENRILEVLVDGLETFVYIDGRNDRVYATDAFDLAEASSYSALLQLPRLDESLLQRLYFQLRRWPYFSEFHYSPEQLVWSAKLSRSTASLAELAKLTQQAPQAVAAFYNACIYSGIAQPAHAPVAHAPVAQAAGPSQGRGLLGALLQRLRGA